VIYGVGIVIYSVCIVIYGVGIVIYRVGITYSLWFCREGPARERTSKCQQRSVWAVGSYMLYLPVCSSHSWYPLSVLTLLYEYTV